MNIQRVLIAAVLCQFLFAAAIADTPNGLQGTLLVLNKSGHDASFIDLESGAITKTLATGQGPHELVISEDGLWGVGTDYSGGDSLTVFDIQAQSVLRTIDLKDYPRPHGIDFLSGDNAVIVTSEASGQLVVVDHKSGEILGALPTTQRGSHMLALSGNRELAFTSNGGSDSVSVINLQRGRIQGVFKVPERPEAITVNKEGSEIWVGSNDEGVVSVLSSSTGKIIAQWEGFEWPYRILLSDDERIAVIPDLGNNSLRFFDVPAKQELARLELPDARPQGIIFHPNDKTLFLSLSGKDQVLVIDADSGEVLGEYPTGSSPDGIAFSAVVN